MITLTPLHHHHFHHWRRRPTLLLLLAILHFTLSVHSLNRDGVLLLAFKYSISSDPSSALSTWTYADETPCAWHGVTCGTDPYNTQSYTRVIGISLPSSQLTGYLSPYLGYLDYLQSLNLSSNSLNGSIPPDFFGSSTTLRILDLSNNLLSGTLLLLPTGLQNLEILNLSDNAFSGELPRNLTALTNLTQVSLRSNYFSGQLWSGVNRIQILDLSSNLINGSLPPDFGGQSLSYLNISFNRITATIPDDFGAEIPDDAIIDLSYNQLTGQIPATTVMVKQSAASFTGNDDLCGKPLSNLCYNPSAPISLPTGPAVSPVLSPPAIAAKPKYFDFQPAADSPDGTITSNESTKAGLRPRTIAIIIAADLAGIMLIALVVLCLYRAKKRRTDDQEGSNNSVMMKQPPPGIIIMNSTAAHFNTTLAWSSPATASSTSDSVSKTKSSCFCLRRTRDVSESTTEYDSQSTSDGDSENTALNCNNNNNGSRSEQQRRKLVTVDGGVEELELETLLKASAYILGASGGGVNILYKAVLEDGSALAVRRIGDGGGGGGGNSKATEFEGQVRLVAKVAASHPNLVKIKGFYVGEEEKLVIYEFVSNGSLANAIHRRGGGNSSSSSTTHLPWDTRLIIAKGVARGLCYLHDKKHVHGNIKPSNILLGPDMDPKIADFGLERFISTTTANTPASGGSSHRATGSTRHFGSKRSTASRESFPDHFGSGGPGGATSPSPSYIGWFSPYHPPESLRTLKPNAKWDVYSFGVVLIELLTGKVLGPDDLGPWMAELPPQPQGVLREKGRVLRMADVGIRTELEGKEDDLLACLKLGSNCVAGQPQKRPSMKEALVVLERVGVSSSRT